jgi:hypothetical protein
MASCYVESCDVASCYVVSCYVASCVVASCVVASCDVASCYVASCKGTELSSYFIAVNNFFCNMCKVTVQRKLTWVKSGINIQLMVSLCSDGHFF